MHKINASNIGMCHLSKTSLCTGLMVVEVCGQVPQNERRKDAKRKLFKRAPNSDSVGALYRWCFAVNAGNTLHEVPRNIVASGRSPASLDIGSSMETEGKTRRCSLRLGKKFLRWAQLVSFAANLAVIAGIAFAYAQIRQAKEVERCRVALDAIDSTRSSSFLEAYRRLREAYIDDPSLSAANTLREDMYYVLNVYDNIAILCLRDVADEALVKASTYRAITNLVPILNAMRVHSDSRTNIDALLKRLKD